ncbi:MAG TPA: hypothetical protein PKC30_09865 [Saprospiraceae bacterium]|nr:hypothetical protein [Saprospiraceae bacterium]
MNHLLNFNVIFTLNLYYYIVNQYLMGGMKKLYVEEQKYHDLFTISVLFVIGLLLVYGAYYNIINSSGIQSIIITGIFAMLLVGIIWLIRNLTLKIHLGKSTAKIKISPFPWTSIKINKNEIDKIEFFKLNELEISSGLLVNFGSSIKIFNFGDKSGIAIKMEDGSFIIIFSDKLYNNRQTLKEKLKDHSWNMKIKDKVA